MRTLELLAPAKSYEYGKAAIDCGADAVYMGAAKFGARQSAGNPADDIRKTAQYAHLYGAKVYVTLNTLLFDNELEEAARIAEEVWEAGADALIVQDMAFCKMKLPPIPLFASTQTANLTPERVKFLEDAGFERVILERALSLEQIEKIRSATQVPLEVFVHGAICVCYSGQCYMSHVVAGRSGNRGVCSQPCRSTFDLLDEKGNILLRNKHLLSVKDLSWDRYLGRLTDAGIGSFKIEGRLRDLAYLKNSVAYYDRKLNELVASRNGFRRSSAGTSRTAFTPAPEQTFNRGFTPYFIEGKRAKVASFDTAKAIGQRIGTVKERGAGFFTTEGRIPLNNGDGICFINAKGELCGCNINKTENGRIYADKLTGLEPGTTVFRNFNKKFAAETANGKTRRTIEAAIDIRFEEDGAAVSAEDETGIRTEQFFKGCFEAPKDRERAEETIRTQFSKSGDTPFDISRITVVPPVKFVPISVLNNMRREILELLAQKRVTEYRRRESAGMQTPRITGEPALTYKANVVNRLSKAFYTDCGYKEIADGVELLDHFEGIEVMRTKYCIRKELGECLQEGGKKGTLYLENNKSLFRLHFDCKHCEMAVIYTGKK